MTDGTQRKSDEMLAEIELIVRAWFDDLDENASDAAMGRVRDVFYPGAVPTQPRYQLKPRLDLLSTDKE